LPGILGTFPVKGFITTVELGRSAQATRVQARRIAAEKRRMKAHSVLVTTRFGVEKS
jgi:hypothetical protein